MKKWQSIRRNHCKSIFEKRRSRKGEPLKLKEALKSHMGEKIKIGASSSFLFCGLIDEHIYSTIEMLSEQEFKKRSKLYAKQIKSGHIQFAKKWAEKLNNGLRRIQFKAAQGSWSKEQYDANIKAFIEEYEASKAHARECMKHRNEHLLERLQRWSGFLDRKVKEIYPSIEEGIIIVITGDELGGYWTYEEYERRWGNDQKDILQAEG